MQKVSVNQDKRIESGAVEFQYNTGSTDWPGLFIRGDDCFGYKLQIGAVLDYLEKETVEQELLVAIMALKALRHDLDATEVKSG